MRRLRKAICERLCGVYTADELKVIVRELCRNLPGIRDNDFYLDTTLPYDAARESVLDGWLERLAAGEPLQYVLGFTDFFGLRIKCDRRALIPRPETTELVEWILQEAHAQGSLLDIGTGTGCIAIALARKLPGWQVSACDVSPDALELAAENCRLNSAPVTLLQQDILDARNGGHYDLIVSNPPYIAVSESSAMERRVLDYEPHLALFVPDNDPLVFYRAIAGFGLEHLSRGGAIYLEINPIYADAMVSMLAASGYGVEVRKDIHGRQRMIKAFTYDN